MARISWDFVSVLLMMEVPALSLGPLLVSGGGVLNFGVFKGYFIRNNRNIASCHWKVSKFHFKSMVSTFH